jgi:tetratricopeptide (TPR) repeat protein
VAIPFPLVDYNHRILLAQSLLLFIILFPSPQADRVSFRIITVATEAKAAELRARIAAGEPFDVLARENSTDTSAAAGGFMGSFAASDLRKEFQTALSGLASGQISPVLKIGSEFFVLQLVAPAEVDWITENAAGQDWLQKRRYVEAARSFSRAVELAEKFGPDDDRLGQSLNSLAETYDQQENFAGSVSVSRRILSIRWSASSNKGNVAVADIVDRFADVLSLAYFRGSQFEEALKKFQDALNKTPANEALYLAMSSILVKAELTTEAEEVMRRAVGTFPGSRRVRYREAEMYRDSGKMRKALETFQASSQMKAPPGMTPERDRLQLSFIYQRIGGINTDLVQFDDAIAAYKKALEISPENADARIALGDVYLRRGQRAEALAEYARVLSTHPDSALPLYRYADANLQLGNFPEAAAAAAKALKIDPQQRKARYVSGMALVRMGPSDEGEKELQEYRKQEADAQAEVNAQRDVLVSNRGASALLLNGQGEDAIALFRKSIDAHPGAAALQLNFALALDILGRPRESAATLQKLLDSGISDGFLIYKLLAREYESLKDERASEKYRALYIRKIDAALEEELQ